MTIVAHCILNQAVRAGGVGGGARREEGMLQDVVEVLMRRGVGALQVECPEFGLFGNPRPPRSKDEYDTPEFRSHCHGIAERACDQVERLMKGMEPEVRVVAVVGVEGSPSCGVDRVPRTVGGRQVDRPGRGHLMEAIEAAMRRRGIEAPMVGVSLRPVEREEQLRRLEALLREER